MKLLTQNITIACLVLYIVANAQEGQLTQFFSAPLYINPAEAGAAKHARITCNYRNQWSSIYKGFHTNSISGDLKLGRFGYGLIISTNDAGSGSLSRSKFLFNIADQIHINSNNILAFGIQTGLVQHRVNLSELKFDNQYVYGNGFDPNAGNGENFATSNQIRFDGGAGIYWHNMAYSWQPKISFSINHLLSPNYSLLADNSPASARQLNTYLEVKKDINHKVELSPYLFYAKQNTASNLQIGARVAYNFQSDQKLILGGGFRNGDAILFYSAVSWKKILFGFSYDMNVSKLKPASMGMGAYELGLSYHLGTKRKQKEQPNKKEEALPKAIKEHEPQEGEIKIKTALPEPKIANDTALAQKSTPPAVVQEIPEDPKIINYGSLNVNQIKKQYILYFDSDKSILKPQYHKVLDELVEDVKTLKSFQVLLNGHTDSDGHGLYNIHLGHARAQEAMKYLIQKGVPIDCIKTFTYGQHSPQADNDTHESKAKNRRVEILLLVK